MRLYRSQIPTISDLIIDRLVKDGDIEVSPANRAEATMDIRAILDEFTRQENRLSQAARDHMEANAITFDQLSKIRRDLAEERNLPTGRDGMRWIINQILEAMMRSRFIDEVYTDDYELRKKLKELFKFMDEDQEIDFEVRGQLKNLRPGTPEYEIEYKRRRDEVLARRGLKD